MKKNLCFLSAIIICAVFCAAGLPKDKLRVKMVVHYKRMRSDTIQYVYDPEGRLAQIRNSGKGAFVTSYNYLPGMALRRSGNKEGTVEFVDTLFLNKSGVVMRSTSNNKVIAPLRHVYDSSMHLIKSIHVNAAGKDGGYTAYSYVKGNKISYTSYDETGNETGKGSYEYFTDHQNTIGNLNTGMDFAGLDSKNPEKSCSYQQTGTQLFSYTCQYLYDAQGRISVRTQYDGATGRLQDSAAYIYYP